MSFDKTLTYPRQAAGWFAAASALSDGCWHSLGDLGAHVAERTDLQATSARSILNDAVADGYLDKRRRSDRRIEYRSTPRGLAVRPELRVR